MGRRTRTCPALLEGEAMETQTEKAIEALLEEGRTFPPTKDFTAQANIKDPDVYQKAAENPEAFWAGKAAELDWFEKWHTVCEWKHPHAKWFLGGKLNVAHNCL